MKQSLKLDLLPKNKDFSRIISDIWTFKRLFISAEYI